jgi:hypothetical protein
MGINGERNCVRLKLIFGNLLAGRSLLDIQDAVMDFVNRWSDRIEIPAKRFITWPEIAGSKFYQWPTRYG